jgi:modulator of FtsH protease HflK
MTEHDHHDHDHPHEHPAAAPVVSVEETGSQALAEALRSSFTIVKLIMFVLIILFFASGVFTVPPQEKAVVFRFGKPVGTTEDQLLGPGLHWSFPAPIDEVVKIPIGQIQTIHSSAGWYATTPEIEAMPEKDRPAPPSLNPAINGYTLTADGNIIHVRATLRYRITDPLAYAFNFVNASNIVQDALDNALFFASSQYTFDRALRLDIAGFKEKILARVSELVSRHKLGITLEPADIVATPPRFVKPAFDEVLAAEQNRSATINTARGYENALLSKAVGESNAVVNAGEADRAQLIQSAASEADYLTARLPEYRKNPELFRQRLITERMQRVLTNAQEKFFIGDRTDGGTRELRLLLNREPLKPAATPEPPKDEHKD